MIIIYLRPDHEGVHRTLDVVRWYLLTLSGIRVRCTRVWVYHLRAERDAGGGDLLLIAVLQRLRLPLLMRTVMRQDAGRTVAVVVVDHEVVGCHPRVARITGSSAHFHLLFVVVIHLDLRTNSAEVHRLIRQNCRRTATAHGYG